MPTPAKWKSMTASRDRGRVPQERRKGRGKLAERTSARRYAAPGAGWERELTGGAPLGLYVVDPTADEDVIYVVLEFLAFSARLSPRGELHA
jgi:hypothetical protein